MPHAETAANALPAGSLVLLEVRRRRKKAKVPPATMAYDARPDWLRQGRQPAIVEGIIEELLDAGVDHQIGIGPRVARPNGAVTTTPRSISRSSALTKGVCLRCSPVPGIVPVPRISARP